MRRTGPQGLTVAMPLAVRLGDPWLACAVRLWLDRRVPFPRPSNACSNFDDGVGWTFFDLTTLHDEFADEPGSVVEADFYHAGILLPMRDEDIVDKVTASALLLHDVLLGLRMLTDLIL